MIYLKKSPFSMFFNNYFFSHPKPIEVNLTIAGVKIGHDPKWGYHNLIQACTSLRQPHTNFYKAVITSYKL
jgi:hypothetical protein